MELQDMKDFTRDRLLFQMVIIEGNIKQVEHGFQDVIEKEWKKMTGEFECWWNIVKTSPFEALFFGGLNLEELMNILIKEFLEKMEEYYEANA